MTEEEQTPLQEAQAAAVERLQQVLEDFSGALQQAAEAGLDPADALEAAGISIPPMAKGMVNMSLGAIASGEN